VESLARRECSRAELARKLKAKGFADAVASEALSALENEGLQSEARFLAGFVRSHYLKGRGPARIRQEARAKGVRDDEKLEECLAECDWDEALAQVHAKKFGAAAPASSSEYAARVRFLLQRGFAQDAIQRLLRHL
jgi:regulatory protein